MHLNPDKMNGNDQLAHLTLLAAVIPEASGAEVTGLRGKLSSVQVLRQARMPPHASDRTALFCFGVNGPPSLRA
jgi:hypothetical protein